MFLVGLTSDLLEKTLFKIFVYGFLVKNFFVDYDIFYGVKS